MKFLKLIIFCIKTFVSVRFENKMVICIDSAFLRGVDIDHLHLTMETIKELEEKDILKKKKHITEIQVNRYRKYRKSMYCYSFEKMLSK